MADVYNVLLPETYIPKGEKESKTVYNYAGVAFPITDGFKLKIPPGMSLHGEVLVLRRNNQKQNEPEYLDEPAF